MTDSENTKEKHNCTYSTTCKASENWHSALCPLYNSPNTKNAFREWLKERADAFRRERSYQEQNTIIEILSEFDKWFAEYSHAPALSENALEEIIREEWQVSIGTPLHTRLRIAETYDIWDFARNCLDSYSLAFKQALRKKIEDDTQVWCAQCQKNMILVTEKLMGFPIVKSWYRCEDDDHSVVVSVLNLLDSLEVK